MSSSNLLAAMQCAAERLYGPGVRIVLGAEAENDAGDQATCWSANVLAVVGDRCATPETALEMLATALRERLLSRADHDRAVAEQLATRVAERTARRSQGGAR
jgi:hypothetical protein